MFETRSESPEVRLTYFVEVLLPLSITGTFTYRVPFDMVSEVVIGKRVVVQFGRSKIYSAIIHQIHQNAPERYEAKYILEVLDEAPIVNSTQLKLWEWISDYYLCNLGEVMQAALPSALKLASETKIIAADLESVNRDELSDQEYLILDALDISSEIKISDIVKLLGQKSVFPILKELFDKGVIRISESLDERYKPKKSTFVSLNPLFADSESKKQLFDSLHRAPKQLDALLTLNQLSKNQESISRKELIEISGCGASAFKSLVDKEVFLIEERVVSRLSREELAELPQLKLSDVQEKALSEIHSFFVEKGVVLLHGITASGKTLLYVKLIKEQLEKGNSALYLLPEIALTTQIIERLKVHFGDLIGVYHSKMNDQERAEVWKKTLSGEIKLILGARSSVFLPFEKLGLIIIDEEHEVSYKQFDPAPRYHARDTAIFMGWLHQAKVLLGSATPSVESYYNAKSGKYGLVSLIERYGTAQLPSIEIVSLKIERKKKKANPLFTAELLTHIEQAIEKKEQVILFQNRRGHSPFLLCRTCGYSPKCIHCDVSLTFHKSSGKLHCHYCGFKEELLQVCPACGSTHIENKGFGTERIEEELAVLFPDIKLGRLDLDSTRSKFSFERILSDFEEHRFDILIGTQMVAKGLDFGKVSLIGIINADSLLNYPDFRAFERSFSMLSQVSGRAGRRGVVGKVIVQAYDTQHRVLEQVVAHDYQSMFMTEVTERKNYSYPPFYWLIQIDVKHKDQEAVIACSNRLATTLRQQFDDRVLGPEQPLIGRIRTYYIQTILLKFERSSVSIAKAKVALKSLILHYNSDKLNKGSFLQVDVDPY
ncbi:MAG TPA: primosomal protein N' [Sphingobacteriaceae bacterium]|nr:primosomal protein N' [Sphingobacteriaceae bacterium]